MRKHHLAVLISHDGDDDDKYNNNNNNNTINKNRNFKRTKIITADTFVFKLLNYWASCNFSINKSNFKTKNNTPESKTVHITDKYKGGIDQSN